MIATSPTGINAGFLWKVGESGAVYLTHPCGECSPFLNPKFVESFNKAQVIAFRCAQKTSDVIDASPQSGKWVPKFAALTEKYLPEEKLTKYVAELEQSIQETPCPPCLRDIEMPKSGPIRMRFVFLLFFSWISRMVPAKETQGFHEEILLKAREAGKEIVYLTSREEARKIFFHPMKCLLKVPVFYTLIDQFFLSKDRIDKWHDIVVAYGKACDLGFSSIRKQLPLISDEESEQLEKIILEELGETKTKLYTQLSTVHLQKEELYHTIQNIEFSEKIANLFKEHPSLMVVDSQHLNDKLFEQLSLQGMQVQGPLRESIKPIGFLWEICKADKVAGYFLGSIHIVPQWILENFNSCCLKAFHDCNVLGVEVDITREDVASTLKIDLLDLWFPGYQTDALSQSLVRTIVREGLEAHQIECDQMDPEFIQKGLKLVVDAITNKFGTKSGIDLFFIQQAKQRGVQVVDLESMDIHQEYGFLLQKENKGTQKIWSYKQFEASFQEIICRFFPEILEMGFIQLLENFPETEEKKQAMARRNMEMAISTDRLIRQGKMPFSIAGARHFTGASSMIKLMEQMGYKVRQVICEELRTS